MWQDADSESKGTVHHTIGQMFGLLSEPHWVHICMESITGGTRPPSVRILYIITAELLNCLGLRAKNEIIPHDDPPGYHCYRLL